MTSAPGEGLAFTLRATRSGRDVSVIFRTPRLHENGRMWACGVTISGETSWDREIYGATSFQALELAAAILPTLLLSQFPGENFEHEGLPVFPTSLMVSGEEPSGH